MEGVFFEEFDGGVYGELIENGKFSIGAVELC